MICDDLMCWLNLIQYCMDDASWTNFRAWEAWLSNLFFLVSFLMRDQNRRQVAFAFWIALDFYVVHASGEAYVMLGTLDGYLDIIG